MHRLVGPRLYWMRDSRMYRSGQPFPPTGSPSPPPPPPRQNKVILQRGYREKEGDCFKMLRDVIKDLTGEELRTRQEILRKATDLLLSISWEKSRGQRETQASSSALTSYEIPTPTGPEGRTLAHWHLGYPVQSSSQWPQTWQSNAEFDAATPYYGAQIHDQQHHFMSPMDSTFDQSSYPEYSEDSSNLEGNPNGPM